MSKLKAVVEDKDNPFLQYSFDNKTKTQDSAAVEKGNNPFLQYSFDEYPKKAAEGKQRTLGWVNKQLEGYRSKPEFDPETEALQNVYEGLRSDKPEVVNQMVTGLSKYVKSKPINPFAEVEQIKKLTAKPTNEDNIFQQVFAYALNKGEELLKEREDLQTLPKVEQEKAILKNVGEHAGMALGAATGMVSSVIELSDMLGVPKAHEFANEINDWASQYAPEDPSFMQELTGGVASMLTFMVPGAGIAKGAKALRFVPKIAKALEVSIPVLLESLVEAGGVRNEMLNEGVPENKANKAVGISSVANIIAIGISNYFGIHGEGKKAIHYAISAFLEGSQEGSQNIISKLVQGKEIDWWQVAKDFGLGSIIGVGAKGVFGGGVAKPEFKDLIDEYAEERTQSPQELDKAVRENLNPKNAQVRVEDTKTQQVGDKLNISNDTYTIEGKSVTKEEFEKAQKEIESKENVNLPEGAAQTEEILRKINDKAKPLEKIKTNIELSQKEKNLRKIAFDNLVERGEALTTSNIDKEAQRLYNEEPRQQPPKVQEATVPKVVQDAEDARPKTDKGVGEKVKKDAFQIFYGEPISDVYEKEGWAKLQEIQDEAVKQTSLYEKGSDIINENDYNVAITAIDEIQKFTPQPKSAEKIKQKSELAGPPEDRIAGQTEGDEVSSKSPSVSFDQQNQQKAKLIDEFFELKESRKTKRKKDRKGFYKLRSIAKEIGSIEGKEVLVDVADNLYIDKQKITKPRVTTEKVNVEDVKIENEKAKESFEKLPKEEVDRQTFMAEMFGEKKYLPKRLQNLLPPGFGQKKMDKAVSDIKQDAGAEQSKEAQIVRDFTKALEDELNEQGFFRLSSGQEVTKEDLENELDQYIEEKSKAEQEEIPKELKDLEKETQKLTEKEFVEKYDYLFDKSDKNYYKGTSREFYKSAKGDTSFEFGENVKKEEIPKLEKELEKKKEKDTNFTEAIQYAKKQGGTIGDVLIEMAYKKDLVDKTELNNFGYDILQIKSKGDEFQKDLSKVLQNYLEKTKKTPPVEKTKAGDQYYFGGLSMKEGESSSKKDVGEQGSPLFNQPKEPDKNQGALFQKADTEKNLVVVHNTNAPKLFHADELGGIAVPSLAIVNKNNEYNNFGNISLVADKDLIDPRLSKGNKVFDADVYSPRYPSITYKTNYQTVEKVADEINETIKPIKEKIDKEDYLYKTVLDHRGGKYLKGNLREVKDIKYDETVRLSYAAKTLQPFPDNFTDRDLAKYITENRDGFDEYVSEIENKVTLSKQIFKGFTPSGNRKYVPYNMDNVLKELKGNVRGGESFFYGAGTVRSQVAKQFKSIADIKKSEDRIVSEKEAGKAKNYFQEELGEIFQDARTGYKGEYSDPSGEFEYVIMEAAKSYNPRAVIEKNDFGNMDVDRVLKFLDDIKNAPTEYFEAKIQRAVGLNEFTGAVVPKGTTAKTIELLKRNGITKIKEYDPEVEGDRSRAIQEFEDVLFQQKNKEQTLSTLSPEQLKQEIDLVNKLLPNGFKVVLDENLVDENGKPARGMFKPNQKEIVVNPNLADLTTIPHEIAHAGLFIVEPKRAAMILRVHGWDGKGSPTDLSNESLRQAHEQIARKYEKYFNEKTRYNSMLQDLFNKLKDFFTQVYNYAKGKVPTEIETYFRELSKGKLSETYSTGFGEPSFVMQKIKDTFYSVVENLVATKAPNRNIRPDQLTNMLVKNGAKQEELDWLDIESYLKENPTATRDDLVSYIQSNNVKIEEIEKGGASEDDIDTFLEDEAGEGMTRDEAREYLKNDESDDTKFAQWQLPGGENYRELLLTMPVEQTMSDSFESYLTKYRKVFPNANTSDEEVRSYYKKGVPVPDSPTKGFVTAVKHKETFKSSHFDEPNILAHVRFNDRTDNEGNKVLFLEEVQSDWGQALRAGKQAPKMPMSKSWHELALKRILRYSAENGYDAISWTTGEQQAERYDLSKRIDEIVYRKVSEGRFEFRAVKDNDVLVRKSGLNESQLEEQIGKDIAKKIVSQGTKVEQRLTGIDLKVGGEGMKGFYDQMIPSFLNKYGKKWKAKVGEIMIPISRYIDDINFTKKFDNNWWSADEIINIQESKLDGKFRVYDYKDNNPKEIYKTNNFEDAKKHAQDYIYKLAEQKTNVFSFPITPEMKAGVLQGQPLFQKSKDFNEFMSDELGTDRQKDGIQLQDETIGEKLERKFVDKNNRAKKLSKLTVNEESDFYAKMELYVQKAADQYEKILDYLTDEKTGFLKRLSDAGYSANDFGQYLWAKHATERNEAIFEKNGKLAGSGLYPIEIERILKKPKYQSQTIKDFEKEFRKEVIRKKLSILRNADVLTDEEVAQFDRFVDYVPLKGKAGKENRILGTKKFSVSNTGIFESKGRTSIPESPFGQSVIDLRDAIIRAEKNKVNQSFLKFIEENPNENIYEVSGRKAIPSYNKHGEIDRINKEQLNDNQIAVYVKDEKGKRKQKVITIHDPVLAKSMVGLGVSTNLKLLRTMNDYLRTVVTIANPEFMITNLERDIQTALINVSGEKSTKLAKQVLKDIPKAIKSFYQGKDAKGEYADWIKEYKASGAKVGWMDSRNIQELSNDFEKAIRNYSEKGLTRRAATKTINFVKGINQAIENGVRVATYANLRKSGVSQQKAAQYAKDLTVNFERKGEWGEVLNSAYLFWNAGMQGANRVYRSLKSKNTKKMAAGLFGLSIIQGYLNRLFDGDDDEYEKLSAWERDNHWIFMLGSGKHLKIKLPYGFNVFNVMGNVTADALFGKTDFEHAAGRLGSSILDAFNPFGATGSWLQLISPTFLDPIAQVVENKNFFGAPIYKEQPQYAPDIPDSELYFKSVTPILREITTWMNKVSGGSDTKSGWLDFNPETMEHIIEFMVGGTGKFVTNAIKTSIALGSGEVPDFNKIPMVRTTIAEENKYYDLSIIYGLSKDIARKTFSDFEKERFLESLENAYKKDEIKETQYKKLNTLFKNHQSGVVSEAYSLEKDYKNLVKIYKETKTVKDFKNAQEAKIKWLKFRTSNEYIEAKKQGLIKNGRLIVGQPETTGDKIKF